MNRDLCIIVPIYNIQKYIRKCIDNIINQSFDDYECLLLDDGSSDECGLISDDCALKDDRIIVIHKINSGVSNARNIGLEVSSSRYVTFCDGDDYYTEGWLQNLMDEINLSNVDFVTSGYTNINESGDVLKVYNRKVGTWYINTNGELVQYIIENILYDGNGWEVWSEVFKKEIIENNNVRFCDTCDNYAEDLAFVLSYCLYARKLSSISGNGYRYVGHEGSKMNMSESKLMLDSFNEVSKFFCNHFNRVYKDDNREDIFNKLHFYIMHIGTSKLLYSNKYSEIKRLPSEYRKIVDNEWNDNHTIIPTNLSKNLSIDAEYMKTKQMLRYIFNTMKLRLRRKLVEKNDNMMKGMLL